MTKIYFLILVLGVFVLHAKSQSTDDLLNVLIQKIVNRDRFGFDLSYDLKNFSLRSEYIYGKDDQTERGGYYVLGGYYLLQKKVQLVTKYDFYDADKSKADDASTWVVLGANYNFNAKLQVNYSIKQEEGTSIDNNFANVQLQIGF